MYLLKALQDTLTELNRVREKSGRSLNHYNYIRSRVSNSVEQYFNQKESSLILASFEDLPHRASQQPDTVDSDQLAILLQHLTDDFTSVLMMVEKKAGSVKELFISDSDFAFDITSKHASGWMDSCKDCGQALHLKYDLLAQKVMLAHKRLRSTEELVCSHRIPKSLELSLRASSKKLVVSDSLNDFLIAHSSTLRKHYDEFLNDEMKGVASTSGRGKALLTEFYASHNLGYFFVAKGAIYLEQQAHQLILSKRRKGQEAPFIQTQSLFISMMDYAEFSGFCNQLGLNNHDVLKAQNARLLDVEQSALSMRYSLIDDETGMPTVYIEPAKQQDIDMPDTVPVRA